MSNTIKPKLPTAVPVTSTQVKSSEVQTPAAAQAKAGWNQATGGAAALAKSGPSLAVPQTAAPAIRGTPVNQRDMAIVCPVLAGLVAEGKVKMAPDGTLKMSDLSRAFQDTLGFSATAGVAASRLGLGGNEPKRILHNTIHQEFNVLELRTGLAKHQGDSAILTGGTFDEAKFNALVSHARGGVMNEDAFAEALAANTRRDMPGAKESEVSKGKALASGEYGALLTVFGTMDPKTGQLGISVDDLRGMFRDSKLPETAGKKKLFDIGSLSVGMAKKANALLANSASMSMATPTGLASAGARLMTSEAPRPSEQAALSAGKAAACPYLNGAVKMPVNNDVAAAHMGGQ